MKKLIAAVVSLTIMFVNFSTSMFMPSSSTVSAAVPSGGDFEFKGAPCDISVTEDANGPKVTATNAIHASRAVYSQAVSMDDFSMELSNITRTADGDDSNKNIAILFSTNKEANLDMGGDSNLQLLFNLGKNFLQVHRINNGNPAVGTGPTGEAILWLENNYTSLKISTRFAPNGDLIVSANDGVNATVALTIPKAIMDTTCIAGEDTGVYPIFTTTYTSGATYSFNITDLRGQVPPAVTAADFGLKGAPCNISAADTNAGTVIAANGANHASRVAYQKAVSMDNFNIKLTNITRSSEADAWKKDIVLLLSTDENAHLDMGMGNLMLVLGTNYLQAYLNNEASTPIGVGPGGDAILWLENNYTSVKLSTEFAANGDLVITANDGVNAPSALTIPKATIETSCIKGADTEIYPIFTTKHTDGSATVEYSCTIKKLGGQLKKEVVYSDDFTAKGTNPTITVTDTEDGGYLIEGTVEPAIAQDTCTQYNTPMKINNLHLRFTEMTLPGPGMLIGLGGWVENGNTMFAMLLTPNKVTVFKGNPAAQDAENLGVINFPADQTYFDITTEPKADGTLVVKVNGAKCIVAADKVAASTIKGNEEALNVYIGMHGIGGTMSVKLINIENLPPSTGDEDGDASDADTAFGWEGQSSKVIAEDTDKGVKITFNNTSFVNDPMMYFDTIATKERKKLDGLHIQLKDINLSAESMKCLNVSIAKSPYVIHDNSIIFLINDYGAATNVSPNPDDITIPSVSLRNDLVDILFVKEPSGDFTVFATSNNTIIQRIPKSTIEAIYGSADPEVYVNLSDKWFSQTGNVNSCVVTACNEAVNAFNSYFGVYMAGPEDRRERIITTTSTGLFENIVLNYQDNEGGSITTVRKLPLDGLTIAGVEMDYNCLFRFGTTYGVTLDSGFDGEGPLIRVDENGDVFFTYTRSAGGEGDRIGAFSNPKEKFTIQCFQTADGGFNFFVIGDESGETFVKYASAEDITELYGSTKDVMVYIGYSELDRSENRVPKTTKIAKISNEVADVVNTPITKEDVSVSISGNKVTASVKMAEGMGYSYQWFANIGKNSNTGGELIEGATAPVFTIPDGWDNGDYYIYCEVTSVSKRGETATVATDTVKYTVNDGQNNENDSNNNGQDNTDTGNHETAFLLLAAALLAISAFTLVIRRKKA